MARQRQTETTIGRARQAAPSAPAAESYRPTWIQKAVWQGMEEVDTPVMLQHMADHVTLEGEWMRGVISPSLCSIECPLQRLKVFLGHDPLPGRTAVKNGLPDGKSNLNFIRGFAMEGVLLTAMKAAIGDRIVEHAPLYAPSVEVDGIVYAGHPDLLVENPEGELELVQFKNTGTFMLDRLRKLGAPEVLKKYGIQMDCELFIVRHSGLPVVRNNLVAATWETLQGWDANTRIMSWQHDWTPEGDRRVQDVAEAVMHDLVRSRKGLWPPALDPQIAAQGNWPCAWCRYARKTSQDLGTGRIIAGCDDHARWELKVLPS